MQASPAVSQSPSIAPLVQPVKSLYTNILTQNRIHAHNPNYKTYATIMNEAESLKPTKNHVHYENKKPPLWFHPSHTSKGISHHLNPKSRV